MGATSPSGGQPPRRYSGGLFDPRGYQVLQFLQNCATCRAAITPVNSFSERFMTARPRALRRTARHHDARTPLASS
jgi:hypothetical protein